MYLNERFPEIEQYFQLAFDAKNGFGSKVLQANLALVEKSYIDVVRNRLNLLETLAPSLDKDRLAEEIKEERLEISTPDDDQVAAYSDVMLLLVAKHYEDKKDQLIAINPGLELTDTIQGDEPFYDALVAELDQRLIKAHERAVTPERGNSRG